MRLLILLGLAGFGAAPLAAQVRPTPGAGDPHIQTVDYAPEQVVLLEGAPGYQITVELSPDEQVENVAVGDAGAWQVSANRRGDRLFVKPVVAGVPTNMTVITNVRVYAFELAGYAGSGNLAYTVRFRYPAAAPPEEDDAPTAFGEGRYRLGGARALRPSEIGDDGTHTYIRWPRDRSLPAVFAIGDTGEEMLVNGLMRDDLFVIDSVSRKLVFRIDGRKATATRLRPGGR